MPCRKIESESATCTNTTRASYCSLKLRRSIGQFCAPGISDLSPDSIWQPLQTPKAKVFVSLKKRWNCCASASLNKIDFAQPWPAPSTSPKENPPQASRPVNSFRLRLPLAKSLMWTSTQSKPAAVNAAAISIWPLTPCSRNIATFGRLPPILNDAAIIGAAISSAASKLKCIDNGNALASVARPKSASAQLGLSRKR